MSRDDADDGDDDDDDADNYRLHLMLDTNAGA